MRSHIINGHYMFGNTFIQPEMPIYERINHHNMAPVVRPMPPYPDLTTRPHYCSGSKAGCCLAYEDTVNKIDTPYDDSAYNENDYNCTDCPFAPDGIIRDPLMFNVVNIETSIIKNLKVTIYGISADQDKTINMNVGKRYAITYITEHGLITSVGRLEVISESIPDNCTRYINATNMAAANTAYIGVDCSTDGNSDKRKIYIATIRYIQELEDGEEIETPTEDVKSIKERLQQLLDAIENGELVFCKNCDSCINKDTEHKSNESESDSEAATV